MWRAFCFTLFLVTGSRQLSMTNFAVPSAVQAGGTAELQCQYKFENGESETDLPIKWWWTPLDADVDERKLFYQHIQGHNSKQLFNITIKDNDTIEILDLEPKSSGIYECEVGVIDELRQHHELIVYSKGSGPQLNISTVADGPDEDDEEDVLITCSASDVAPEPDVDITIDGETLSLSESVNEEEDGLYSVSANATVSKDRAHGALVRCELFYKKYNISHPAYIDALTYDPSEGASTTEAADRAVLEAATDSLSLQRSTDGSSQLHSSWLYLLAVAIPIHLLVMLI